MFSAVPPNESKNGQSEQQGHAALDFAAYAAILAMGAFYLYSHLRSPDFPFEDVAYYEQAKSLLHDGYYGFNSVPERVQPPGLPLLLALICKVAACRYGLLLSSMSVFLTLGFLVWYRIIRQVEGRGIAAATCLMLGLSPGLFLFVTRGILPSTPYLLVSGISLWMILKLDVAQSQTKLRRYLLSATLALLVAFAVLLQSAAIALVGAMLASIAFTWLKGRGKAAYRLKVFLPAILLGILTQFAWMHRASGGPPPDWPLPGYPESYVTQLKLKLGNYPEMGFASATDVFWRVWTNVRERTAVLAEMLTSQWIYRSYSSVAIAPLLVFTVIGWACSLGGAGEDILAWYFFGFDLVYILWPWQLEFRFLLPNTPLACLFIYRGAGKMATWFRLYPRRVAACFLPAGTVLCAFAFRNGWAPGTSWHVGLQSRLSTAFWFAASLFAVWVIWKNRLPTMSPQPSEQSGPSKRISIGSLSLTFPQAGALGLLALLLARAIAQDVSIARGNRAFGEAGLASRPDIVAANWVRLHTDPKDVIAARHVPLVYHHSHHRVIWFAPIVRSAVLMEGFRRLNVRYVIVIDRDYSYYLPPDEDCFEIVEKAYPNAFRLAAQIGQARIYEVVPRGMSAAAP